MPLDQLQLRMLWKLYFMVFCLHLFSILAMFCFNHCQMGVALLAGDKSLCMSFDLWQCCCCCAVALHLNVTIYAQHPTLKWALENSQSIMGGSYLSCFTLSVQGSVWAIVQTRLLRFQNKWVQLLAWWSTCPERSIDYCTMTNYFHQFYLSAVVLS